MVTARWASASAGLVGAVRYETPKRIQSPQEAFSASRAQMFRFWSEQQRVECRQCGKDRQARVEVAGVAEIGESGQNSKPRDLACKAEHQSRFLAACVVWLAALLLRRRGV